MANSFFSLSTLKETLFHTFKTVLIAINMDDRRDISMELKIFYHMFSAFMNERLMLKPTKQFEIV